jgi:predicted CoA-substrate-specific enzyme activase
MRRLGIDFGSLTLSLVLLEGERIVARYSCAHEGRLDELVQSLVSRAPFSQWDTIGITGSVTRSDILIIDNTLATIEGARMLLPSCRNLIAMGGQSFSLILLDSNGRYMEHVSNPPCSSGTGSFLEQQAERLGLNVKDLAQRALSFAGEIPRIATRCAVFAKTDIVHAMQEGHSLEAICAGLCEGIARSMLDMLLKGRKLLPPVGLVGGVALNSKIAQSIGKILKIPVKVPEDCQFTGAIGAALLGAQPTLGEWTDKRTLASRRAVREPTPAVLADYPSWVGFHISNQEDVEIFSPSDHDADGDMAGQGFFLGIDIGSTSTKAALISAQGEIAKGFYTRTGGNPVAAAQRLLKVIETVWGKPRLLGAATTGSGRSIIRGAFRADIEVNEITAHARAAVHLRPDVDTIIEIGGQDSKFTRLRNGDVYFSTMNYVCAAGTGSFIEEQARRLGVSLPDFSDLALAERAPFTSDRCTVYMERDLAALVGEGWPRQALAAAVLHSVRDNYLSKVVGKSQLGNSIVFQGATARNKALVATFEQHLGKTMHVSPWCHLTGALGAALLCREEGHVGSNFLWETGPISLETEECGLCANHCRLTVMDRCGSRTGWGMKCGREYSDRKSRRRAGSQESSTLRLRFRKAMRPLSEPAKVLPETVNPRKTITIGVPRSLYNVSYEPLWRCFLSRLGFSVIVSNEDRTAMEAGAESVNSDFCAPVVLAHGYVRQMVDRGVDFIFLPAIENSAENTGPVRSTFRRRDSDNAFCYYSQYLPSIVGKLTAFSVSDRLITPLLPLREKSIEEIAGLLHEALSTRFPDITVDETVRAFTEANAMFAAARKRLAGTFSRSGRTEAGAPLEKLRVLILGRPYVAFDENLSLALPQAFERLGADVFWQEELDLEDFPLTYGTQYLERMHWHYGKLIVRAAEFAARTENLFPVFLTCFRCSPDSFLMSYVKDILTHFGKPFLFLQLDAHASDVGYLTRIEAALHSFRNHRGREIAAGLKHAAPPAVVHARDDQLREGDTVLIPAVDALISSFWADVFCRMGYPAVLLEGGPTALNTGYQFTSGGECMPLVSIIGATIERMREDSLDPSRTFFFMPTSPFSCNMPQFPILSDMTFHAAGIHGLKIGKLNFMALGDMLPQTLSVKILETYIVACILYKLASRVRPYEVTQGETNRVFQAARTLVQRAINSGADLRATLADAVRLFRAIRRDESAGRKPRVALLGDLYVKYNAVMNDGVQAMVEELGGELLISSMTEYPAHLLDIGWRRYGEDPRSGKILRGMEQRYEKLAEDLIGDAVEPDFAECVKLMEENGFPHYIAGETAINVGKALWYCVHKSVDAIVHINPMFCCPGVVTASLYRRIQADFGIPIVDIFFDGVGSPNRLLIPHLHYMRHRAPGLNV